MYTRHKAASAMVFIVSALLSYLAEVSYDDLAVTALTVVSISVAVYIAAMSALLGSPYADKLRSILDSKIRGKSQLGVLVTYLRAAGNWGVLTIIISSLYQIPSPIPISPLVRKIVSSGAFGIFAINLLFLWLVFHFFATALVNSAQIHQ